MAHVRHYHNNSTTPQNAELVGVESSNIPFSTENTTEDGINVMLTYDENIKNESKQALYFATDMTDIALSIEATKLGDISRILYADLSADSPISKMMAESLLDGCPERRFSRSGLVYALLKLVNRYNQQDAKAEFFDLMFRQVLYITYVLKSGKCYRQYINGLGIWSALLTAMKKYQNDDEIGVSQIPNFREKLRFVEELLNEGVIEFSTHFKMIFIEYHTNSKNEMIEKPIPVPSFEKGKDIYMKKKQPMYLTLDCFDSSLPIGFYYQYLHLLAKLMTNGKLPMINREKEHHRSPGFFEAFGSLTVLKVAGFLAGAVLSYVLYPAVALCYVAGFLGYGVWNKVQKIVEVRAHMGAYQDCNYPKGHPVSSVSF